MNQKEAIQHLADCGVEIHMLDTRSAEEIAASMIARGVIPPLRTLETEGMTLPVDQLELFAYRAAEMSITDRINC